ncbi:hypothetical protein [Mucilaginibacter sp. SMC90]|nr:hypothetical protein [Mucilaginibacter sp. SMC90]
MSQINEEKYSCHNPRLLVTGLLVAFGGLMICGVIALSVLLIIGF